MVQPLPGVPRIVEYERLDYPKQFAPFVDNDLAVPDLTGGVYNQLEDLNGSIDVSGKALISTAGNYIVPTLEGIHPLMSQSLKDNLLMTHSPPLAKAAFDNERFISIGNLELRGKPIMAAGGGGAIDGLGDRALNKVKFVEDYGSVLVVRKDLRKRKKRKIKRDGLAAFARERFTLTISNPKEGGSYNRYLKTTYDILEAEYGEAVAESLFSDIYADNCWVAADAPMHRGVFHNVLTGDADAALAFYHLAYYHVRKFPDIFEIIPLGEFVDPEDLSKGQVPVAGNVEGGQFYAFLDTPVTPEQEAWRQEYADLLLVNEDVKDVFRAAALIPLPAP